MRRTIGCLKRIDALRNLVRDFCSSLFTSSGIVLVNYCTCISFPHIISLQDMDMLSQDVSFEETRQALFSKQNLKSPGPDGYHPMSLGVLSTTLYEDALLNRGPFRELVIPFSLFYLGVIIRFMWCTFGLSPFVIMLFTKLLLRL